MVRPVGRDGPEWTGRSGTAVGRVRRTGGAGGRTGRRGADGALPHDSVGGGRVDPPRPDDGGARTLRSRGAATFAGRGRGTGARLRPGGTPPRRGTRRGGVPAGRA